MNNNIELLLDNLSKLKYRGSFHLNTKMKKYVQEKGINEIRKHCIKIINERIKPAFIANDGKQTPYRQVHPVFIAQHACGCCCRDCIEKIHHIKKGKELSDKELNFIIEILMSWIIKECTNEVK